MELGSIKQGVFLWMGWISVVIGLSALAAINIVILWGINLPMDYVSFCLWLTIILGTISTFNKNSRSLGFWGLGLGIYLGFFISAMFILGWMVNPFP